MSGFEGDEEFRYAYAFYLGGFHLMADEAGYPVFDAWLKNVRAEAWDEGFREAGNWVPDTEPDMNPYKEHS